MFSEMKIGTRLTLGFGALTLAGLVVAGYGTVTLQRIGSELHALADERVTTVLVVDEITRNALKISAQARDMALLTDEAQMKQTAEAIAALKARNGTLIAELDKTATNEKGRALLQAAAQARAAYNPLVDQAIAAGMANRNDEARTILLGDAERAWQTYEASLTALVDYETSLMTEAKTTASAIVERATWLMLGIALAAVAGGVLIGWRVTRGITRPLADAMAATERIARGDLASTITVERNDEVGRLLVSLREMQASLARVVGTVRENAESVATASAQIAQGNQDLSQRTEEQASSLQQTAASMDQLGSTVRGNADNARQANQLAQGACDVAVRGGQVVEQVVETMKGINDSSRRIAEIIGTIDGIAFQTNILALNAAVEAARAGEQGRGFAVVAGEVRNLAQRSAEAAREIKRLITDSVERVDAGSSLVDQAGSTMTEIVAAIRRVTDLMGEISSASGEQSEGVSQVAAAVTQMDQVTQQNAALVEESAAAAESLKQQSRQLVEAVAAFKLAAAAQASHAPAPAAAAPRAEAPRTPVDRPAPAARPRAQAPATPPKPAAPAPAPAPAPAATADANGDWETF